MKRILQRGRNYWRTVPCRQAGLLVDGRNYYAALASAARQARRYILLAGWQFDSGVALEKGGPGFLDFLNQLCAANPKLRAYILAWDFNVFYTLKREFLQSFTFDWNAHPRIQFRFDNTCPLGASHHQKFVVVDGTLAFVGGMDICEGTWNERGHQSEHPRHDVQAFVTGRAARRLARLFARRWRRAGGKRLWLRRSLPRRWRIAADLLLPARRVAICRTLGATLVPLQLPVREVRHLFTDAIAAAESLIYAENQYFASAAVYEALAARMREPNRPKLQIVILLPRQPEDFIEEIGLGTTQARYLRALTQVAAETGHALGIYNTRATDRLTFIHAKLLIVDDRFLTVGSANFSNRSMGFDSELNLAWEARSYRHRQLGAAIRAARVDLLAEHTGVTDRQRLAEPAGLVAFLDNLTGQRLCRHQVQSSSLSEIVTDYTPHDVLIDPEHSLLPVDENGLFAKGITALRRALFGR